jgi:hypothetical protein
MRQQCFSRNDANPPVCGVHQVPVVQRQISIDPHAPELGRITCSMCPVSRAVIQEEKVRYARNSY